MRKPLTLLLFLLSACGGTDGSTTGPVGGNANGTFKATIDGQAWESTFTSTAGTGSRPNETPGGLHLSGSTIVGGRNTSVDLFLGYINGPGTYLLGVNDGTTAGGWGSVTSIMGTTVSQWVTGFSGAAGTVTISSLLSSRLVGTFQFTAPGFAVTQTTGTKVVTNGAFDVPLPAGFAPAPPGNKGSKISGTIGGVAWNAATIVAKSTGGAFAFVAATDSIVLSLAIINVVTSGSTYPLGGIGGGPGVPAGGTMTVQKPGTSLGWSASFGSSSVGSITFTSWGGSRATGSFTATLLPGPGTTGTLAISGTFDVRLDP